MDILNLENQVRFDDRIESLELHSHFPFASSKLDHGEEIIISLQHQDIYTLPGYSFIYIEGRILKKGSTTEAPSDKVSLTSNALAFLFDEVRYELNGVEIDRVRNPGIASTLKGYVSFSRDSVEIENYGWAIPNSRSPKIVTPEGYFSACIPLSAILGFAEDYKKLLINIKQDLIFIRSRMDSNSYKFTRANAADPLEEATFTLTKLSWRIPYVTVSGRERLALLKHLESGKVVSMGYRAWELYEYPLLPQSQKQVWAVKTSSLLEKPRYVIVGFQTDRKNDIEKDGSNFDHCDLINMKLYLNSKVYPYDDLHLDFTKDHFSLLYYYYSSFRGSFYQNNFTSPFLTRAEFKNNAPIVVIDCSKQQDSLKSGSVDVRLEFESSKAFPNNTCAYCLIVHDRVVEYSPFTGIVRKMV